MTVAVFFGKHAILVPLFPHAYCIPVFVVVLLESLVPVEMPAFPVAYGVVVLVVAHGLLAAGVQPFYEVAGPLAFALAVLVFSVERHVAEYGPAFNVAVRNSVLVLDFEFLDTVVVPLVALENVAIGVNPHGGLLCAVNVFFDDLFLGAFNGACAKAGKNAQKVKNIEKNERLIPTKVEKR